MPATLSTAQAATLYVNCGARDEGLNSIGAALKRLQYVPGPSTINVSGACHENVVIQNLDRITLIAAPGASINDVSGGNADTVQIASSQSVSINNFTINGGASGVDCILGSLCYLNGNTIQGATGNAGVNAAALSRVFVSGGTLQNNFFGVNAQNGGGVWAIGVLIQQNQQGVNLVSQGLLQTNATITALSRSILRSTASELGQLGQDSAALGRRFRLRTSILAVAMRCSRFSTARGLSPRLNGLRPADYQHFIEG